MHKSQSILHILLRVNVRNELLSLNDQVQTCLDSSEEKSFVICHLKSSQCFAFSLGESVLVFFFFFFTVSCVWPITVHELHTVRILGSLTADARQR